MNIFLNIGSNLGDREAAIGAAVARITSLPCFENAVCRKSDFFISKPWGYISENEFLNIGLVLECNDELDVQSLMPVLQEIEKSISLDGKHRDHDGHYMDRVIDIDMIAVDQQIINTPQLTIPHSRMHMRNFVLYPMLELAPYWIHPILKKSLIELIKDCE